MLSAPTHNKSMQENDHWGIRARWSYEQHGWLCFQVVNFFFLVVSDAAVDAEHTRGYFVNLNLPAWSLLKCENHFSLYKKKKNGGKLNGCIVKSRQVIQMKYLSHYRLGLGSRSVWEWAKWQDTGQKERSSHPSQSHVRRVKVTHPLIHCAAVIQNWSGSNWKHVHACTIPLRVYSFVAQQKWSPGDPKSPTRYHTGLWC